MLMFICGFPSGGTDLAKTMLNAHPDIYLNGEMPFLKQIGQYGYDSNTEFRCIEEIKSFQRVLEKLNTWGNIENVHHDFSPELAVRGKLTVNEVLKACFSDRERLVWGNKTPQNTENIGLLNSLFPDAYFLIVVRDVRDICLSWKNKWGKDKLCCAEKWTRRMQQGWSSTRQMPVERYLFVKFEDLLLETESCCQQMCMFLNVPFSDRMLRHHEYVERPVDGKINYGRAVLPDNINKWEHSFLHKTVVRIEEIAFDALKLFNYPILHATSANPLSPWERICGNWNDVWAALLVGNRARQDNGILYRTLSIGVELRKRFLR